MADGGKRLTLCWGQSDTYDTEPHTSQGPWSLRTAALSCFWKFWLEALGRGFEGDQVQAWNNFTAHVMASIPEDIRDDRDILSMMDLQALTDSTPPEQCHPNALLNQFDSKITCRDTKISMEERAWRATTLLVITAEKWSSPTRSRGSHTAQHEETPSSPTALCPHVGLIPETMIATLPPAGEGIIPSFTGNKEQERTVSFKDSMAPHGSQIRWARDHSNVSPSLPRDTDARNEITGGRTQP
jgi:hypothetical protein